MKFALIALAAWAAMGLPAQAQDPWTVQVTFTPGAVSYPTAQAFTSPITFSNVTAIQSHFNPGPLLWNLDPRPVKAAKGMDVTFDRDWDGEALLNALVGIPSSPADPIGTAVLSSFPGAPGNEMVFLNSQFVAWDLYAEQGDVATVREQATFTYSHRQVQAIPGGGTL
jgi:hypothetical protein